MAYMQALLDTLLELIRRTSAEIPDDVQRAIISSLETEKKGTIAESALKIIERNIELAKRKSQPICQDTVSIIFYVSCPVGFDQIEFESQAREAVKLAPRDTHVRWQMANLLLRTGQIEQSLEDFREVAAAAPPRLPAVMSLVWQAANGNFDMLDRVVGQEPQARLALARFLVEQKRFDLSAQVFNRIDRESRFKLPNLGEFFDSMLSAGQWQWSGRLWRETMAGEESGGAELFWNGSFDRGVAKSLAQFDWQFNHSDFARLEVTEGEARTGRHALTVAYQGRDTTRLDGEVRHALCVRPGGKYRLEFFAKSEGLTTPDGPQVAILRVEDRAVIAGSAPAPAGSNEWQRMVVDFIAPADYRPKGKLYRRVELLLDSIIAGIAYAQEVHDCKHEYSRQHDVRCADDVDDE